ncbi:hypothetical protein JFN88_12685 [Paenibacillus sp. MAHUQ-46]|uniref:Uncharacterized protein n=2 Tax=Paenibacillus TaxID=44249 RepID=A0A934MR93_9BACL|nr:hypothetical protein [Paenibacillus roseus]
MKAINLNEDQKAVLLKETKDLYFAAQQLHERIKEDKLAQDMSKTLPSLIESYFASIAKLLNYESHLTKEHEERYVEIRKANQRAQDLERQLASSKPIDGLAEQLEGLRKIVYDWWKEEGFRHVSEIGYTGHGSMKVEFSFMLSSGDSSLLCDNPVTDARNKAKKIQQLIDRGFDLEPESENSRSWDVLDTENNRRLLTNMLFQRFPSIVIAKIESWNKGRKIRSDKWTIWRLETYIHDLRDIPGEEQ